jgi:hypothetical protein
MAKGAGGLLSPAVITDFKHACAISLSLAFFLLVIFIDWDPIFHGRLFPTPMTAGYEGPPGELKGNSGLQSEKLSVDENVASQSEEFLLSQIKFPKVRKLVEDIQAATREASGGIIKDLTAQEKDEWIRQNPCKSRSELLPMYDRRKYVKALPKDPVLDLVFSEYSKFHRACMLKVGNSSVH